MSPDLATLRRTLPSEPPSLTTVCPTIPLLLLRSIPVRPEYRPSEPHYLMDSMAARSSAPNQSTTPFDKRWEELKPVLEQLYHRLKLPAIMEIMEHSYRHRAKYAQLTILCQSANMRNYSEAAYKYRFKRWGRRKNIPSLKKEEILEIAQSRALEGKSTKATYLGRPVDKRRLQRQARQDSISLLSEIKGRAGQSALFPTSIPFSQRM